MIEFKDYELDEKLTIGLYCFKVSLTLATKNYFLAGTGCDVEKIFQDLKVDKYSYVQSIVGYESKGAFPETETLEDLNKVIKQLQIDCLIKDAKEKYPVGTVFKSIFNKFNYISSGKFQWLYEKQLIRDIETYGVVWGQNEWAEIIPEEPKQPEINTYGLSVGNELPFNILNEWTLAGNNRYQENEFSGWRMCNSGFIDDRKIESFKLIDGTVGFLVSGTNEVYLRAEGFKEFAEGFNKSVFQFEVGKWYKSNVASNNFNKFYYLKVLGVEKGCPYGQAINIFSGKNYDYNKKHRWMSQKTIEQALSIGPLTDLSEIQQYLPDGHPDKIKAQPEYIVGKWYRMGAWIGKFRKLDGDRFCVFKSGTPFDNYKFFDGGHLSIKSQGTPVLITDMTEVYKLFPEEKPNDDDFEVNDWVVIERLPRYSGLSLPQTSTIFQVNRSRSTPYAVTLTDKDGGIFYFRKEELRHATPEEVDKELERRWLTRGERAIAFSEPGESVIFENKPITLKSNQAAPIVLEEQQVPELTITIKTNKTNNLFINPIKTIKL